MKLKRIDTVSDWRLCIGCGVCSLACPIGAISLVDIVDVGIRPTVDESKCEKCGKCTEVCPGIGLEHEAFPESVIEELAHSIECWQKSRNETKSGINLQFTTSDARVKLRKLYPVI